MLFTLLLALLAGTAQAEAPEHIPEPEPIVIVEEIKPTRVHACEEWRSLVALYDWDVEIALKVIEKESSCNPNAMNPEAHKNRDGSVYCYGSYGLMQVSCHDGSLYDPEENIAAAYRKYQQRQWAPWGVCKFEKTCAVLQ